MLHELGHSNSFSVFFLIMGILVLWSLLPFGPEMRIEVQIAVLSLGGISIRPTAYYWLG